MSRSMRVPTPAAATAPLHRLAPPSAGAPAQPAGACAAPPVVATPIDLVWQSLLAPIERFDGESQDASEQLSEITDRSINALLARATFGLSPAALSEAYLDWFVHLAMAPGKRAQLMQKAFRKWLRLMHFAATCALPGGAACIEPLPHDRRFAADAWKHYPFNVMQQAFLLQQQWWTNATTGVKGVTPQHERQVEFASRQILDMMSPANFPWLNPAVIMQTQAEAGANLVRGYWNFIEDCERALNHRPPVGAEAFKVGGDVAVTPGKVIHREHLFELIQYAPATGKVHPEPVLIVPAWIMKYYILDLSPDNSLIRYLTEQGFTVFAMSWRNPTSADRDLGLEDYRMAVDNAVGAVNRATENRPIHGVGYCLGGTLLSIAAAATAGKSHDSFKTVSLFATQVDFEEPGELGLFISESQVSFLEDAMWQQGYLSAAQMAGAFQLLRSNDLIWSRILASYMMGVRQPMTDLMAWNADATRMPYRMHSDYLRKLFLGNDLIEGRFLAAGKAVALSDISVPVFAVATETDHVAPWKSVFKLHLTLEAPLTFLLTTGGHNTGIVGDPHRPGRSYRVRTKAVADHFADAETWARETPALAGFWWDEWVRWLQDRSGAPIIPPRIAEDPPGSPRLPAAPGSYVLQH